MFNLYKNIYITPYSQYYAKEKRCIFAKRINDMKDITPNRTEPIAQSEWVERYVANEYNNDYSGFFRMLFSKANVVPKRDDQFLIFADPVNTLKLLTIWFNNLFPKTTEEDYNSFIRIFLQNHELTYFKFNRRPFEISTFMEDELKQYRSIIGDKGKLLSIYQEFSKIKLDEDVVKDLICYIPTEYLLYFKASGKEISDIKINQRLERILLRDYLEETYFETRQRLLSCLPLIGNLFDELDYDPTRPECLFEITNHPSIYFFLMNDTDIPIAEITQDFDTYHQMVRHINADTKELASKADTVFNSWDILVKHRFTYQGLVEQILELKGRYNNIFRNEKYWKVMNHLIIGAFMTIILGGEVKLDLNWLEGAHDDLLQEWR